MYGLCIAKFRHFHSVVISNTQQRKAREKGQGGEKSKSNASTSENAKISYIDNFGGRVFLCSQACLELILYCLSHQDQSVRPSLVPSSHRYYQFLLLSKCVLEITL